ncbi:MAG: glutamate-5-semialdehyde dehydrogenase [bacterium]|nr:glutamate-5-semialdehyde dehydrogenase [bacterium]
MNTSASTTNSDSQQTQAVPQPPAELNELFQRAAQESYQSEARRISGESRQALRAIRQASNAERSQVLVRLAELLGEAGVRDEILQANRKDVEAGRANNLRANLIDRLEINAKRLDDIIAALREIAAMPDPVGEVILGRKLASGVDMIQKRVPLGVVFTIYESRPNVTVDIGALCVKSGNCAILRGGKEAVHSNVALAALFRRALKDSGLPENAVQLVEETDRAFMLSLLQRDDLIDLVVPRGGEQLIRFIAQHSRIPVVKHDKGVCNLYVDPSADFDQSLAVAINAKLQRTSVCNTIENLIIHKDFPRGADLLAGLAKAGAKLLGDEPTRALFPGAEQIVDEDAEYGAEYLDERLSVKIVDDMEAAVDFIYKYGSEHSECIMAQDALAIRRFEASVDTAAVCINCSTRFHDGGQMGMGAEVGISTGRLHVRGPMGLRDLTTTTYVMQGSGHIRS